MTISPLERIFILLFCGVVLLGGLTTGELYRNEGLRARLALELLESGDWLVPRLYGEPHLTKPPGMGIAIAGCSLMTGSVTAVTARMPSVVAGALAIALVGWAVGRRCGTATGWLAAAILPCVPLWLDRVPSAEIDLVQLAWVTASMVCLLEAAECGNGAWVWWLLALLAVAGGFFTKWTAPAFFYLTAIPLLGGRWRLLFSWGHLAGVGLFVGLGLIWLVIVGQTAGLEHLWDTLRREALLRFSPGHHPRPYPFDEWVTFPLGFLAGCLPWSLVALPALSRRFVLLLEERERPLWRLAVVWLGTALVFWTLAPGHRPRHLLPAQPAVAILAVLVCQAWRTGRIAWPVRVVSQKPVLATVFLGFLALKLVFVWVVVPKRQGKESLSTSAQAIRHLVPPAETLHLIRLKSEGLLFYYGRPARRVSGREELAGPGGWVLLTVEEWRAWPGNFEAIEQREVGDGQGKRVVLVKVAPKDLAAELSSLERKPKSQ